jgi:hypothetical protein
VLFEIVVVATTAALGVWQRATQRRRQDEQSRRILDHRSREDAASEMVRTIAAETGDAFEARARFVTRVPRIQWERWTYVELELPAGYPLALRILPDGEPTETVAAAFRIDGNPAFATHVVEGAPRDVVRALLAPTEPRSLALVLQSIGRAEVRTLLDGGRIAFCMPGSIESEAGLRRVVEAIIELVRNVRHAYAEPVVTTSVANGPYRAEMTEDGVGDALSQRRTEEVDQLRALWSEDPAEGPRAFTLA